MSTLSGQHDSSIKGVQDGALAGADRRGGLGFAPLASRAAAKDKIYIIGWSGAIGGLVAHSLATIPDRPPIVLLHHKREQYERWKKAGETIVLQKHGVNDSQGGFESQMARDRGKPSDSDAEPIYNLIVATKAMNTLYAVRMLAKRLRPESTVVLLQNGMGQLDLVNNNVYPKPETRPNYMLGVLSHGAQATPDFLIKHTGPGSIALTALPREPQDPQDLYTPKPADRLPESAKYLLRTLTGAPALCAIGLSPADFLQLQLEKLAANAVINPLTAILGCSNGELMKNENMVHLMRLLLAEISVVVSSLPELAPFPRVRQRFSSRSLELYVINIVKQTSANRSSMLVDMDLGRPTEIGYINGYIIRRGEELGIRCIVNYAVVEMVRARQRVNTKAFNSTVPLTEEEENPDSVDIASERPEGNEQEDGPDTGMQHG